MRYTIALGIGLAVTWILLSGHFEPLLLGLGAASCIAVLVILRAMHLLEHEGTSPAMMLRLPLYVPWLVLEIVKANLDVARRILSPRLPIDPCVIRVRAGQSGDLCRVIYANSITLTPGTVSIDTEGDTITVHALSRSAADGVETGEMDRKVSWLEGGR
jgi:multicomponent Na+:H+ antiporter subunit E